MSNLIQRHRERCRDEYKGNKMSDELVTEQRGYRTTKEIIENMLLAGEQLNEYRLGEMENYDTDLANENFPEDRYDGDLVEIEEKINRRIRYVEEIKKQKNEQAQKSMEHRSKENVVLRESQEDPFETEQKQKTEGQTNRKMEMNGNPAKEVV